MNKALLLSEKPSPPTSQKLRPLISASPVQIKEEISRLLELIQQNLTNDKLTKLEDPTHQLMGMVGMLGINRLYDLALRLNKSAQQQSFDKANNDFQEILLLWKTIDK